MALPTGNYVSYETTGRMVLDFIRAYVSEHGHAPSQRQIMRACYMGHGTVRYHIARLEQRGLIRHQRNVTRGIELVERNRD